MLCLPPEVIINILSNLDLQSLLVCQRTCRKFKEIYDESSHLQYIAELEMAGMIDNPYCTKTFSERLDKLRKKEERWAVLQSDFTAKLEIPKVGSSVYDVTPNVYLLGIATMPGLPGTLGIQSMMLPSELEDTETPFMELRMIKQVVDFGTSIEEHDLLAVVTICRNRSVDPNYAYLLEVALVRHSTAAVHDEVQQAELPICGVHEMIQSVSIEICGENLAIVVFSPSDPVAATTLHIFHWKSGRRKGQPRIVNNLGLVFLREDLLLVPNTQDFTFGIYYIPYIAEGVDDERLELHHLVDLALPALKPSHIVESIQCRCDPTPTAGGVYPKYAPTRRPFANDPMQAIMITELSIRDMTQGTSTSYAMFVHRHSFLDLFPPGWEVTLRSYQPVAISPQASGSSSTSIEMGEDEEQEGDLSEAAYDTEEPSTMNNGDGQAVPWGDWGQEVSRWFDSDAFTTVYITSTAGQRFVTIGKGARREPKHIRIIDFNQYNVRKVHWDIADLDPSVVKAVGVYLNKPEDEDEPWATKEPFVDPGVQSNLPYMETISARTYNFNAVLLDEQRILGIRNGAEDDWSPTKEVELIHYG